MNRNYYAVLGVPKNAEPEAIRDAYIALARQTHPDAAGTGKLAQFQLINEAYITLRVPTKRAQYDKERALTVAQCTACGGTGTTEQVKGLRGVVRGTCNACQGTGEQQL